MKYPEALAIVMLDHSLCDDNDKLMFPFLDLADSTLLEDTHSRYKKIFLYSPTQQFARQNLVGKCLFLSGTHYLYFQKDILVTEQSIFLLIIYQQAHRHIPIDLLIFQHIFHKAVDF